MERPNPITVLSARYPPGEATEILRTLSPFLSQDGRALAPTMIGPQVSSYSSPPPPISTGPNQLGLAPASKRGRGSVSDMQANTGVASSASSTGDSADAPGFQCPFCFEAGNFSSTKLTTKRKAGLRKHFKAFHMANEQWICLGRKPGDCMTFDCKQALDSHVREAHNPRGLAKYTVTKLCPQVVFACGFSHCRFVLEASSEADAHESALTYFKHVLGHFDGNVTHRHWSYSVRFRNLMRQTSVNHHWKERRKGKQHMSWQPFTSSGLRKVLETRHFYSIPLLIEWAVQLGSVPDYNPRFSLPRDLPQELHAPMGNCCRFVSDLDQHDSMPQYVTVPGQRNASEDEQLAPLMNTICPSDIFLNPTVADAASYGQHLDTNLQQQEAWMPQTDTGMLAPQLFATQTAPSQEDYRTSCGQRISEPPLTKTRWTVGLTTPLEASMLGEPPALMHQEPEYLNEYDAQGH
ncbi:hypothetical protein B0T19DRAFT_222055 [Cercophora scortea]|uniref:C2H2-type domain-containing protein n=1 Tax=Cercophora scortea TaxID=314031 RepID=A0AAE0IF98_9PEZI|nr:hypothetical protein B0T19DRAFT_222055 [Cercophora scortea]